MAIFTTHDEAESGVITIEWPEWIPAMVVQKVWRLLRTANLGKYGSVVQQLIEMLEMAVEDAGLEVKRRDALTEIVRCHLLSRASDPKQQHFCWAGVEEAGQVFRCGLEPEHSVMHHAGLVAGKLHIWPAP